MKLSHCHCSKITQYSLNSFCNIYVHVCAAKHCIVTAYDTQFIVSLNICELVAVCTGTSRQ